MLPMALSPIYMLHYHSIHAEDVFQFIPGLISCAGVTGSVGITYHAAGQSRTCTCTMYMYMFTCVAHAHVHVYMCGTCTCTCTCLHVWYMYMYTFTCVVHVHVHVGVVASTMVTRTLLFPQMLLVLGVYSLHTIKLCTHVFQVPQR